jgi:hypothetical protein
MPLSRGYRTARREILAALASGEFQHEARNAVDVKNLLAVGEVTPEQVAEVIRASTGLDHSASPHHVMPGVDVHVIRSRGWYVKFYFLEPGAWFISVHR